ncbi:MAG: MerR family transcriptional regulator [Candidatus Glassbacteria bacterium]|nr:MerR family transcriptional regulator [Candidatus Glassbacteria bacterium]
MLLRIGKVAREVEMSVKRIIEYEKEGLIKPLRKRSSSHRLFSEFEIRQIKRIRQLIHERGFTLSSIKHVLNMAPCWVVLDCDSWDSCPAYNNPHQRCWELKNDANEECSCMGTCERCPVYLVKDVQSEPLFEKTP